MFWSMKLCRVCSEICDICIPIFDENTSPSIDIKIKRCMSVIITKEDMKPHQICRPCLTKLNDFYTFIGLFHDSDYKFENILFHYSLQHPSGVLSTQSCADLQLPSVENSVSNYTNLNTDISMNLNNPGADQQILNEVEQAENILHVQSLQQISTKNCMGSNNYYTLESISQTVCNRNKKSNLVSVPYILDNYRTDTKQNVSTEPGKIRKPKVIRSNIKVGKYTCAKCSKIYSRKQRLTEHLIKHTSSRPFMCDQCGKAFAIKWDFTLHKRTHTSTRCCQYCAKSFNTPSKLQRHIRTHTNERPFICKVEKCGVAFSDKSNLVSHQLTHTNIRNFKCNICKQHYKTKSQLTNHLKAHSETPSFRCKICGKCFKWKANLYIHNINVHSDQKHIEKK